MYYHHSGRSLISSSLELKFENPVKLIPQYTKKMSLSQKFSPEMSLNNNFAVVRIQYYSQKIQRIMVTDLLVICDGFITFITQANRIFKAHDWIRRFVFTTPVTHCSATFSTMMLKIK